jgi:predicted XRE-type DNA-binding protein
MLASSVVKALSPSSRPTQPRSRVRPDFPPQIRVPIKNPEQFDQGQGRFRFPGLVAREGIDPAAEDLGRFALVEVELLAQGADERGVFATAWDAVADTPEEAAILKARADLMIALADHIEAQGWTQAEAAKRLGVTQPRISDLVRGKFNLFGLDHLVTMLARAGQQVDIRVKKSSSRKKAT